MNFNFAYIALRVKIMVPPPHIVYYMVKAVFVFYYKKDKAVILSWHYKMFLQIDKELSEDSEY